MRFASGDSSDANGNVVGAGASLYVMATGGMGGNQWSLTNVAMNGAGEIAVLACANTRLTPFDVSGASISLAPTSYQSRQGVPVPTGIQLTMAFVWSLGSPSLPRAGSRLSSWRLRPG